MPNSNLRWNWKHTKWKDSLKEPRWDEKRNISRWPIASEASHHRKKPTNDPSKPLTEEQTPTDTARSEEERGPPQLGPTDEHTQQEETTRRPEENNTDDPANQPIHNEEAHQEGLNLEKEPIAANRIREVT